MIKHIVASMTLISIEMSRSIEVVTKLAVIGSIIAAVSAEVGVALTIVKSVLCVTVPAVCVIVPTVCAKVDIVADEDIIA